MKQSEFSLYTNIGCTVFSAEKVDEIREYLHSYADPILVALYTEHKKTGQEEKVYWDVLIDSLQGVFEISDFSVFEECLWVMGAAGYLHGSVDSFFENGEPWDNSNPLKSGKKRRVYLKRWVALTEIGESIAAGIIERADKISKTSKAVNRSALEKLYDAIEIKPGAFGLAIDVKKLIE